MSSRVAVACLALLLAPALGGCLTSAPETRVHLPVPRQGDTYVYRGPTGARLAVEVGDTAVRVDTHLVSRDVHLLNWSFRPPDLDHTYRLWEAIDPETGRIVQQTARCLPAPYVASRYDRACYDDRAVVILAAAGLPGAFGTGPLWGRTLGPGPLDVTVRTAVPDVPGDRVRYSIEPAETDPGRCLELTRERPTPPTVRAMSPTVLGGPLQICDGRSLPQTFTGITGDRYTLEEVRPGDGPAVRDGPAAEPAEDPLKPPVPRRDWTTEEPFLVSPDDDAIGNFTLQEAHRWAMDNVSAYRQVLEGDPGGLVTGSQAMPNIGRTRTVGGATSSSRHDRVLLATRDDGTGVQVRIAKRIHRTALGEYDSSISLEGNRTVDGVTRPNRTTARASQVQASRVHALGRQLVGTKIRLLNQEAGLRDHPWTAEEDEHTRRRVRRTEGYTVNAWYHDPSPPPEASLVINTHDFAVDGPTGTVLYLELNRTRLPLKGLV